MIEVIAAKHARQGVAMLDGHGFPVTVLGRLLLVKNMVAAHFLWYRDGTRFVRSIFTRVSKEQAENEEDDERPQQNSNNSRVLTRNCRDFPGFSRFIGGQCIHLRDVTMTS